MLGYERKVAN